MEFSKVNSVGNSPEDSSCWWNAERKNSLRNWGLRKAAKGKARVISRFHSGFTIKSLPKAIAQAQSELESEARNLDENTYLCSIFELDSLIVASQKHGAEMMTDLVETTKLWKVSEKLEAFINSSKKCSGRVLIWTPSKIVPRRSCRKSKDCTGVLNGSMHLLRLPRSARTFWPPSRWLFC